MVFIHHFCRLTDKIVQLRPLYFLLLFSITIRNMHTFLGISHLHRFYAHSYGLVISSVAGVFGVTLSIIFLNFGDVNWCVLLKSVLFSDL